MFVSDQDRAENAKAKAKVKAKNLEVRLKVNSIVDFAEDIPKVSTSKDNEA